MSDDPPKRGKGWPRAAKPPQERAGGRQGRKAAAGLLPDDEALEEALTDFLQARYGAGSMAKSIVDQHIRPALRVAIETYERAKKRPRTE